MKIGRGCLRILKWIVLLHIILILFSVAFSVISSVLTEAGVSEDNASSVSLAAVSAMALGGALWRRRRKKEPKIRATNERQISPVMDESRSTNGGMLFQDAKQRDSLNLPLADYEDLPRLEAPAGYVYVIQDVSHSRQFKIGRTNHPARRLNRFDVVLPIDTKIVALLRSHDAVALENRLHRRYRSVQTRGEWFELAPDQIDEIRNL